MEMIWQGGQLSFIKSIGYEPQSVSPGDVAWFLFSYAYTHTQQLYSELFLEANTISTKSTQTKYLLQSVKYTVHLDISTRASLIFLALSCLYLWIKTDLLQSQGRKAPKGSTVNVSVHVWWSVCTCVSKRSGSPDLARQDDYKVEVPLAHKRLSRNLPLTFQCWMYVAEYDNTAYWPRCCLRYVITSALWMWSG